MPQTALLRRHGLLEQIAVMAAYQNTDPQFVILKAHGATLKAGVAFAQSIKKLESLGSEEDRARKDKKRTMISQVLTCGSTFQKAMENVEDLKTKYQGKPGQPDEQPMTDETQEKNETQLKNYGPKGYIYIYLFCVQFSQVRP